MNLFTRINKIVILIVALIVIFFVCICVGSVNIPIKNTLMLFYEMLTNSEITNTTYYSILIQIRIPRVICVALCGASLSLCGGAMQGLLRNPLADGSTLGVSAGASLGAIIAIILGLNFKFALGNSTMIMAIIFAFLSLVLIISISYKLDYSLSTNTIILVGVVFSMFANSLISLMITFAKEKIDNIIFWTMGSLAGRDYMDALVLLITLLICSVVIIYNSEELNALAIGEDNARNIGVDIKKTKLIILIFVSICIGVCVSISGTIGFVGLVIPHLVRMIFGPNHKILLPISMFAGGGFLMLTDLISRTIFAPVELPLGVITSLIGSVVFVYIFAKDRK